MSDYLKDAPYYSPFSSQMVQEANNRQAAQDDQPSTTLTMGAVIEVRKAEWDFIQSRSYEYAGFERAVSLMGRRAAEILIDTETKRRLDALDRAIEFCHSVGGTDSVEGIISVAGKFDAFLLGDAP